MAEKSNITVRVPNDTYQRFEEYRKSRPGGEISKADAGRRLLERGLDDVAEEEEETPTKNQGGSPGRIFGLLDGASSAVKTGLTFGLLGLILVYLPAPTEFILAVTAVALGAVALALYRLYLALGEIRKAGYSSRELFQIWLRAQRKRSPQPARAPAASERRPE